MITIATYDDLESGTENDIALDASGKNIAVLEDAEAVVRVVKHRVQTRKFECQYNMNKGVPYFETVFANSAYLGLWTSYITQEISNTPEVSGIDYFSPREKTDARGRKYAYYECGLKIGARKELLSGQSL